MTELIPAAGLDAVMKTLVDAAIVIDSKGLILLINPAAESTFGYTSDELIGRNVTTLMPEPYHSEHDGYITRYLETSTAHIIGIGREVEGRRKSGEIFPMSLAVGEMAREEDLLFVGIIRDLTEERRREAEFDELQARHFHLSRVTAMNEMGTAIAHEINQPLAAAANYIETAKILASRAENADERLTAVLEQALSQNHRAAEIISRMRSFIERGDVNLDMIDLETIIDDSLMLGLSKFRDRHIEIIRDVDSAACRVRGDAVQIQQVLVNLIRNGCEAMADVNDQSLRIVVERDSEHPDMVRVSLSDKGIGLEESIISDLFTAFTTTKTSGLGVGLSISRSIIRAHGGRIWAVSNDGPGSTFSFTLPLADSE